MTGETETVKRDIEETNEESAAKARKIDEKLAAVQPEVQEIQEKISNLNDLCREEQETVQFKFDQQKKTHFEKRSELLKTIPHFWRDVLINSSDCGNLFIEEEQELMDYIDDIKLEDSLDRLGSHKFTFYFKKNPFFEETVITKEIKISKKEGSEEETVEVTCTPITFTKNPLAEADADVAEIAFLTWLQSQTPLCAGDFGYSFREKIWEEALSRYENTHDVNEDEDDDVYDDDEDEEADEE